MLNGAETILMKEVDQKTHQSYLEELSETLMQEAKTIARPYTTAIFEIASGTGQFEEWEKFINELSDVVDNPDFKSVELGAISVLWISVIF